LKIVMPLDKPLSDRLLRLVSEFPSSQVPSGGVTDTTERTKQVQDLSDTVQSIAHDDPGRVVQLRKMLLALRGGNDIKNLMGSLPLRSASQMSSLFSTLRGADQKVADELFMQGVASVRSDYDYTILFALSELAFPTIQYPSAVTLPVALQQAFLEV